MCQLNLYLLPEGVPEQRVIAAFLKCGMKAERRTLSVCGAAELAAYAVGCCNCDSVVSRAARESCPKDNSGFSSFDEYVKSGLAALRQKSERYARLLADPDFPAKNAAFEAERERLIDRMLSFTRHIGEYEAAEIEKLKAEGVPEQEFSARMQTVYAKIQEMYREAESGPEYLAAQKAVQDFLAQNQEPEEFWGYDPKFMRGEERNFLRMTKRLKKEYAALSKLLARLAALAGGAGLYPFWQDGSEEDGPMPLAGRREKPAAALTIDDIVLLPYQNLLWLSRD